MGATEQTMRSLEVLQYQMHCQGEFARSGMELAAAAVAHWQAIADGFRSDCAEAMQARASAATFKNAARVFSELLAACEHAEHDAEAVIGVEDKHAVNER